MLFWFVLIIYFENNLKNQYLGWREIHPSQMEHITRLTTDIKGSGKKETKNPTKQQSMYILEL